MRTVVVNSHVANEQARNRFMASVAKQPRFASTEFILAVGGHPGGEYDTTQKNNVITVLCPHNSIDFTGLVALVEVPELKRDSYFYVHDTCEAGPGFLDAVVPEGEPRHDTASFVFHSMNMGAYSWAALQRHRDLILSFKNEDLTPEGAARAKRRCIILEDAVFRDNRELGLHAFVDRADPLYEPIRDVYGNGVMRMTNWYPVVDLYKHKANWKPRDEPELRL